MAFILRTVVAGIAGSVSYLFVRSALRPRGWGMQSSLTNSENYLALGVAAIVFGIVLWRIGKHAWGKEQVEKLLEMDDTGY